MSVWGCTNPPQMAFVATLIAIELSEGQDLNELNIMGNWLVAIGSIMLTIAAQEEYLTKLQESSQPAADVQTQIQQLQQDIKQLQTRWSS